MSYSVKESIIAYLRDKRTSQSIPKTHKSFLKNGNSSLYNQIISSINDEILKEDFKMKFYIIAGRYKYESRIKDEDNKALKEFHKILEKVSNSYL